MTRMVDVMPLVSTQWLATHVGGPQLRVIDIRSVVDGGARAAYEATHVPGAIHTDYAKDGWRVTKGMAAGLLPEPAEVAGLRGGAPGTTPHRSWPAAWSRGPAIRSAPLRQVQAARRSPCRPIRSNRRRSC